MERAGEKTEVRALSAFNAALSIIPLDAPPACGFLNRAVESPLMSSLVIQRVTTARQKKMFLRFPWTLYRGDPNWIPPLRGSQKEMVGYKPHPFYERNLAQTFLALRDGEVCGRIAAILNRGHNERYEERRGFFGFFDCRDDQEAANGLFDAVRSWFAAMDIHKLRGPCNPSLNYELGLLVDGFDSPPTFMMTYNPPYYERLIENYGFRKTQDLYAFWGHVSMLPKISEKLGPIADQIVARYDVKVRTLDRSRFQQDVALFLDLYNRSLVNTWGFVPMTRAEVSRMSGELKRIIVPELTACAESAGRVVGGAFGLPDYNPRIRDIDGRLFPFGFIHLLRNRRAIKRVRLISTNVLPEFQRMGIGLVLMNSLVPKALAWGIEEAEFSWVLESNRLSYGALKKGGAQITKTYRLYDLDVPEDKNQDQSQTPRKCSRDGESAALPPQTQSQGVGDNVLHLPAKHHGPQAATPNVEIREVRSRADLERFLRLPWRIYADDPNWVPPLLIEVKEFLDKRKHPFYRHGEAAQFIAMRGGEAVGRVLVSDDPRYNEERRENIGCFGMFECIDDPETAHALLAAAAACSGRAVGRPSAGRPTIRKTTRAAC